MAAKNPGHAANLSAPSHRASGMRGRDPNEAHRASTPLELLFDLTFVIAFGSAAEQFADALAEGHYQTGLLGFGFAMFAVCWAWINFSWFASAYDTDDWLFRLATMVQMIGVLIVALGLPRMFASIEQGARFDVGILVLGYVVMRLAAMFQWLRAARQDPARRNAALTYAGTIAIAQVGWVAWCLLSPVGAWLIVSAAVLYLIEMAGPILAESKNGGTPWHAHHIAERYGLLAIIALGEGVVGTVASMSAIVETNGWTADAFLICAAGVGLTFGMWWVYFILPSAPILHHRRRRAIVWGYAHMLVFAAIAATGAGLHVAAISMQGHAHIGEAAVVLTVAVPVGLFVLMVYGLYYSLIRTFDWFHLLLLALTAAVLAASIGFAQAGVSMTACLIVVMLGPVVSVVGYEVVGHRHATTGLQSEIRG